MMIYTLQFSFCASFLLLIGGIAALPKLRSPHLETNDGLLMAVDIVAVLKDIKCSHDLLLDYLYSDAGHRLWPKELTNPTSEAYVKVYDGNIELLSLLNHVDLLKTMCEADVIKDLSSMKYCDEQDIEEMIEKSFISEFNETLTKLGLMDLLELAAVLQGLQGQDECEDICGGEFKTVLCKAFTEMAAFMTQQMIFETTNTISEDAEQLAAPLVDAQLPNDESLALSGAANDISPGNIRAPPSGNQANNNPLQGGQADLPPRVSPPSGALADGNPSLEPPSAISASDMMTKLLLDTLKNNPNILDQLMLATNPSISGETSIPSQASDTTDEAAQTGNDLDSKQQQQQLEIVDIVPNTTTFEEGAANDEIDNQTFPDDLEVWTDLSPTPAPLLDPDDFDDFFGGDTFDDGLETGGDGQEGDDGQEAGDGVVMESSDNDAVGFDYDYEDDDTSGSYSSFHVFSIMIVLLIFAVSAYLCIHNKKTIKEKMKDYVSDKHKRRRTRDYKPLLSGN